MTQSQLKYSLGSLFLSLGVLPLVGQESNVESVRAGRWEAGPTFVFLNAESYGTSSGNTTYVYDADPSYGGGVSLTYHLTEHIALSADLLAGNASGTSYLQVGSRSATRTEFNGTGFTGLLNGEWSLLKSKFTPVIAGTVGFATTDAERVAGASSSEFVYGLGAGARWDISDRWSIKGLFRALWSDVDLGSRGTPTIGAYGFTLNASYKF
jgi:Outer membrane protein beta-barrel domain